MCGHVCVYACVLVNVCVCLCVRVHGGLLTFIALAICKLFFSFPRLSYSTLLCVLKVHMYIHTNAELNHNDFITHAMWVCACNYNYTSGFYLFHKWPILKESTCNE